MLGEKFVTAQSQKVATQRHDVDHEFMIRKEIFFREKNATTCSVANAKIKFQTKNLGSSVLSSHSQMTREQA